MTRSSRVSSLSWALSRALIAGALLKSTGCSTPLARSSSAADRARQTGSGYEEVAGAPVPEPLAGWRFPTVEKARLANGLGMQVLRRPGASVLELRLVVLSGSASDGHASGTAALTGQWLKAGGTGGESSRQLLERIEAIASNLTITTTPDATIISLGTTSHHLGASLALLASVAREPRFSDVEFERLKRRELARRSRIAASSSWLATRALHMELFRSGPRHHPYAAPEPRPRDIAALDAAACRAWYAAHFSPKNAVLIAVGDVGVGSMKEAAAHHFDDWEGGAVPPPVFLRPSTSQQTKVVLVARAGAAESELRVAALGPERQDARWPSLSLATHVLGAGPSSRARSALNRANAGALAVGVELLELAYGPSPIILAATVPTPRTGVALAALLSSLDDMVGRAPSGTELALASGALSNAALLDLDATPSAASLLTRLGVMDLGDDYYNGYRSAIMAAKAADVRLAAADYLDSARTIVVVGDADQLLTPLSRFGQVDVVEAMDMRVQRIISRNPEAPLEIPPRPGG